MYEREETPINNHGINNNKKPAHIAMAEDVAKAIISSYSNDEQNEIIRYIRAAILEQRNLEIQEMQNRLDYLRNSFDEL